MTKQRRAWIALGACLIPFAVVAEGQEAYEGRTVSQWIEALESEDWDERVAAAWALSEIGPPAAPAVPSLLRALRSELEEGARMMSAYALGMIGQATDEVLTALREATNDPAKEVREAAAGALRQLAEGGEAPVEDADEPGPGDGPPEGGAIDLEGGRIADGAEAHPPLWSEEEAGEAVRSAVQGSYSLGLLDAEGDQLNPHVPANAISLTVEDTEVHAALAAGGSFRTIADVVDYLAGFGVRLSATGRTITVEDVLADLQGYVEWSFAHPDDPRSGLGVLLGSGPVIETPDEAPEVTGATPISTIASLMMLADLVCGVADHDGDTPWGQAWRRPAARGVLLAALGDEVPRVLVAQGGDAASALRKVNGFITRLELDPNFVDLLVGREAMQWERRLLALFDCQNRLVVRLSEPVGQASFAVRAVGAQWRGDAWWIAGAGGYRERSSLPLTATVGFMSTGDRWIEVPLPRLQYTARLWSTEDPSTRNLSWVNAQGELFGDDYAPGLLGRAEVGRLLLSAIDGFTGDVSGAGPLVRGADARFSEGGTVVASGYRTEGEGRALDFGLVVSTVADQPVPTESPFGVAYLGVTAKLGARDFLEFWLRLVEPMRVMGLTPAEDEALVELATDKLLDVPRCCRPIVFESKIEEEPAEVRTVDLLGESASGPGGMVARVIATHLRVASDGSITGLCALQDNRETPQWMWLENLGTFSGGVTEKNLRFEAQRRSNEGRDRLGRLDIGKFEATGTWRGVRKPPGEGAAIQRGLTGRVLLRGTLLEGEKGEYIAEGEMQFHDDGDWLEWQADETKWESELKQWEEYKSVLGEEARFPRWEHPDWLEGE